MKKVKWGALLVGSGLALGVAAPDAPVQCLAPLTQLPCAAAGALRGTCAAMQRALPGRAAEQITAMAQIAAQPATRQLATQVARGCGGSNGAACAVAQVLGGAPGDGLSRALATYSAARGAESAGAVVYWSFLLAWPLLDDVQQRDWANDLAGRLLAPHGASPATTPEWLQPIARGLYCAATVKSPSVRRIPDVPHERSGGGSKNR